MSEPLLKPCLGMQEITPIAENLVLLYRRSRLLEQQKREAEPPSDVFPTLSKRAPEECAATSQPDPRLRLCG